ncbi:MAG: hypothetical protein M1130_03385 [Actinobacteria bacterium]|nr:hypothetical protein [Actinomycetota bacterium]
MTTAQLTGELQMGHCAGSPWRYEKRDRQRAGGKRISRAGVDRPAFRSLTGALLEALEREDTFFDRAAGYGICGLAFFYLAGQVVRSIF